MDFVKILRSFEEFLYEVMAWLLFYPLTLWRVVRHPLQTMAYSDREQTDTAENKYDDAVSPPLFMMLSILLAHLFEIVAHDISALREGFRSIFQTDQTFLLLRCVMFGLYPLIFAATLVRRLKLPLNRDGLRAPFFAQCYVTAPGALFMGFAGIGLRMKDPVIVAAASALALAVTLWFMTVQTRWFMTRANLDAWRSLGLTLWLWAQATAIVVGVGALLIV